ncbi:MAG: EAL domain-containing protein [Lachnospiraceae bacterium]|nr:EAL domain-containing protein [Lachnospiraceae bacterium]
MIYYDHLPLDEDILNALGELSINYVFQPIFEADGKTVFAREALMRPTEMTVMELIEEYTKEKKLHVLEVATFFGAMQEYQLRGYDCRISMNSFPSEQFTLPEQKAFAEYYGDMNGLGIIEILEYPYIDEEAVEAKRIATEKQDLWIAIDDFGTGINNMDVVNMYDTKIVKLDRHLISGIDHEPEKQENVRNLVLEFHSRGILVLAEGVEEKEEFDQLVGLGVDLYQGYYLAMPA